MTVMYLHSLNNSSYCQHSIEWRLMCSIFLRSKENMVWMSTSSTCSSQRCSRSSLLCLVWCCRMHLSPAEPNSMETCLQLRVHIQFISSYTYSLSISYKKKKKKKDLVVWEIFWYIFFFSYTVSKASIATPGCSNNHRQQGDVECPVDSLRSPARAWRDHWLGKPSLGRQSTVRVQSIRLVIKL